MPMREECKHFQSRTYDSGEVARFCLLDLAPDAPWKCPDDCPSYSARLADVGWAHGSLVEPKLEEMPDVPDKAAAALLGQAEEIVNADRAGGTRRGARRRRAGGPPRGSTTLVAPPALNT